ncbi:MAG TPA: zinc-dependent metalloprotease [Acidimicrobiia bacterium]|nr:zinc-dependent metalloprotease [Acidimicrobiia bacterium]
MRVGSRPDPVDWPTATRVARLVAGRDQIASSYLGASLARDFAAVTTEAEDLVADFTGLRAPGRAHAQLLDRGGWVEANVASMRTMLAPLTERLGERLAQSPIAPVGRRVAGVEVGSLLGYLSQRVLGQYDLLVPDSEGQAADTDAVYYVGPNILGLEKRFAFRPLDFRRWIAIHEVTHRAQFTGVPWMKDYFLSLVQGSLSIVDPDPAVLLRAIGRIADAVKAGKNPLDEGGLVGLFASPEQQVILERVQALMSLLEGHGNYVMNVLGERHVQGADRMARVLHARRQQKGISGQMQKLLGIEMKMRQYEVGERFVRGVERIAGIAALDAAWRDAASLPTVPELDDPEAWLTRVASTRAATG